MSNSANIMNFQLQIETVITPVVIQKAAIGPNIGTSFSSSFVSPTTLGNTLIVVVQQAQGTAGATYLFSDSQNNAYIKAATIQQHAVGQIDLWYATAQNGECTFTATDFNLESVVVLQYYEVSGLLGAAGIISAVNEGTGTSLSSQTISTSENQSFCLAAFSASGNSVITARAGWSQDVSDGSFGCQSQIQSAAGAITGTATSRFPVSYVAMIVAFLPVFNFNPATSNNGTLVVESEIMGADGTIAAVKQANTPATSSDPALVVAISPNNSFDVNFAKASITNTNSISASSSNIALLVSNAARLGATIYNDSSALLYLKLGAGASLTNFTIKLFPFTYYEIPYGYSGEIDGFWSIAFGNISGFARVSELM
jgi:hypothetical protein